MRISYIEDLNQWRSSFSFSIPVTVRFSETDLFGHMNNTAAFIYFEQARIEFLKAVGIFDGNLNTDGIPVVSDLQCDFLKQLYFDQTVDVYVKAHHVGRSSVDIHYMVLDDKQEIALTGRGRLVYIHAKTGKPVSLEASMRAALLEK
ncbi:MULTISPECIES: acyl-CoA thioesterase [Virgibacillus]|uniref:acyl-CoA thioesterase n=1 Tax=Virgibacillus TaxID=84406 RepID=UPI00090C6294|nr:MULTISPECIES: thioesterase family protein [Virgibacillus]API90776.1 hypothetical protein BKP57_02245 [Virgibacillus sp. 6R]MBS7426798.1 acyl-CoA thioesterase [Virgibacillus sp. 19R1-5]GIP65392.1 4-hydroxybenzoyl-CoA thioesterase [Virgibacillus pantothenticus]